MGFMFPVKRNTGMLTNMPAPWRSKAAVEIMHFGKNCTVHGDRSNTECKCCHLMKVSL